MTIGGSVSILIRIVPYRTWRKYQRRDVIYFDRKRNVYKIRVVGYRLITAGITVVCMGTFFGIALALAIRSCSRMVYKMRHCRILTLEGKLSFRYFYLALLDM